ncbi:hypothetical protein GCM10011415_01970 [Salipiger pallidus]|uniref:Uncharacterized protein n=1 Tax=Salipiger pallidus TaxID=1775170 RepID=A0A8J3EDG6_9RHOB|nr:hypothetical protein [Salipiger pallidus]GGG59673.1 hypothetical protein GCM10011415_01970 [Salipiger pallidus]
MTGHIALLLRVFILLPLAGLAAALPFVAYDKAAGLVTIDINTASTMLAVLLYGLFSGGTFAWSRWVKRLGGRT